MQILQFVNVVVFFNQSPINFYILFWYLESRCALHIPDEHGTYLHISTLKQTCRSHIDLKPGATPVNTGASRSVREPLLESLKNELDSLTAQRIIAPISQATEWLHPF